VSDGAAGLDLALARDGRDQRGRALLDDRIDFVLDEIGLSDERLVELAVSPADREKLKGILQRLARQKHPFSQCMRDLAKHRADLPEESRKRICGRLKSMIKGTGRVKALSLSDDPACPLVDADVSALLSQVDDAALEAFESVPIDVRGHDGCPPEAAAALVFRLSQAEEVPHSRSRSRRQRARASGRYG
jgi:hypothetical protein